MCSGWTEAIPLLVREQTWWWDWKQSPASSPVRGINSDNDSAFIDETLLGYCKELGIEFTRSRAYRKNDQV